MRFDTQKILGVVVTINPKEEILEEIRKYLQKVKSQKSKVKSREIKPFVIFTPNPEIISFAQKDEKFKQIVNMAQINLPDGNGIVWAMKKIHGLEINQIAGVDFMLDLVNLASNKSLRIGLIGGRGDLAVVTRECLLKKYPNLLVEDFEEPEFQLKYIGNSIKYLGKLRDKSLDTKYLILNTKGKQDDKARKYFQNLVEKITEKNIDILFVALGFPKQEYFIESIKYHVLSIKYDKPLVLMAVGGSFDYISGRVPRASRFLRNLGLEWLFRLMLQPWRLPRQLKGSEFFWRLLTD